MKSNSSKKIEPLYCFVAGSRDGLLWTRIVAENFDIEKKLSWCLHLWFEHGAGNNEMPVEADIDQIEDDFIEAFSKITNTAFAGRSTWNGFREIFFYVETSEMVNEYLLLLINDEAQPIKFGYHMQEDREKLIASEYLGFDLQNIK
jgi:hypothetical protein